MYEALTRARHRFLFTTAQPLKPSRFIAEALGYASTVVPVITSHIPSHSTPAALVQTPQDKEFYLSYSRIDSYLVCPAQYQYRYVLQMPSSPNVYLVRAAVEEHPFVCNFLLLLLCLSLFPLPKR